MTSLDLPAVLAKGDNKRVAHTASDYWSFVYNGFKPTGESPEEDEGTPEPSPAESDPDLPTPVEVLQRPRRGRQEAQKTSNDGEGQTDTQGSAAGESGGDLTATPQP
jgi:hypothetical protein